MEWSNPGYAFLRQGRRKCHFTLQVSDRSSTCARRPNKDARGYASLCDECSKETSVAPASVVLQAGECPGTLAPMAAHYRECACYYWPASRPDYVNVEAAPAGISRGENWMSRDGLETHPRTIARTVEWSRMKSYLGVGKNVAVSEIKGRKMQRNPKRGRNWKYSVKSRSRIHAVLARRSSSSRPRSRHAHWQALGEHSPALRVNGSRLYSGKCTGD